MKIRVYTSENQGNEFYAIMGPFFADSRRIMEEMTLPLYNDKGSTWFIGFDEEEKVIGFCCFFENKRSSKNFKAERYLYFDNFYIVEAYRSNGHSREMFDFRMVYVTNNYKGWTIEAMSRDERQLKNYERYNFEIRGKRGSYRILAKEIEEV